MIKLIATDLDGTLLDSNGQLPREFFEIIPQLRAKDIHIVIASGRQYFNILKIFEPVKDDLVFMADNGAFFNIYGKTIVSHAFKQEHVEEILAIAEKIPTAHPVLCCADCAYTRPCKDAISSDINKYYTRLEYSDSGFEKARKSDVIKIAVHDDINSTAHLKEPFSVLDGDDMITRISGDVWLDVMPTGVDKGDGMKRLQEYFGVSPDECMAFGDFENDLGLISSCTESYAMDNAVPSIKEAAKYLAPSNDDAGVLQVLKDRFHL